jgi:2-methylcitrate dehydratase PrpD
MERESRVSEKNLAEQLAAMVVETEYGDIPKERIEIAKLAIIDIAGNIIAGSGQDGVQAVREMAKEKEAKAEATILIYGDKVLVEDAALVNSVMARALDFGHAGVRRPGTAIIAGQHISESAVPAVLTLGEAFNKSGKEALTALVVGTDVGVRVGISGNIEGKWDETGVSTPFGITAMAGKLMGLNKEQMRNAFGIVLNMVSGTWQCYRDGVLMIRMNSGWASKIGIEAARMARKGITGVKDAFGSDLGYFNLFYPGQFDLGWLVKDLGKEFRSEFIFKLYPSGGCNMTSIDSLLALMEEHKDIVPANVKEVRPHLSPFCYGLLTGEYDPATATKASSQFNIRYNMATTLLRGWPTMGHLDPDARKDADVVALTQRVKPFLFERARTQLHSIVEVEMKDGTVYRKEAEVSRGDVQFVTKGQIVKKYKALVTYPEIKLPKANTDKILEFVRDLEAVDDVSVLVPLFHP